MHPSDSSFLSTGYRLYELFAVNLIDVCRKTQPWVGRGLTFFCSGEVRIMTCIKTQQTHRSVWQFFSLQLKLCPSKTIIMSYSPERMSSYRRRFEGTSISQFRTSSPSPTRREVRHRSASFNRNVGWKVTGCRALTNKRRLTRWVISVSLLQLLRCALQNWKKILPSDSVKVK